MSATILVATWSGGLFTVEGATVTHHKDMRRIMVVGVDHEPEATRAVNRRESDIPAS